MSRTARKAADRLAIASLGCSRDPEIGPSLQAQGLGATVQFFLQRSPGGLYVERDENPRHGVRCIQSIVFRQVDEFLRWCDEDHALDDQPHLRERLQRTGLDRWDGASKP